MQSRRRYGDDIRAADVWVAIGNAVMPIHNQSQRVMGDPQQSEGSSDQPRAVLRACGENGAVAGIIFLKDEGRYDEATNQAVKRVIAFQLAAAMENRHLTKSAFARQLKTSRSQLDRLLDPDNTKVTLDALTRAAHAVGRELQLKLR